MDTIAEIDDAEPDVTMTYVLQGSEPEGDAGDQYTGLDRFGRVVDSRWINSDGTDINRVEYGYNEASNRIWRQNIVAGTGQDEYYTYDGLYQLGDLQRGTLNEDQTGISGTPAWEEDFTYDPIGNWQNYLTKVSGATTLDQDRTQNMVNETTSVSGSSSLVGYDSAGNMTTTPQPADWSSAYDLTYDAWNRLVNVASGDTAVAAYAYDGLNRRITKTVDDETRHYYYSSRWQILEERTGTGTSPDRQFIWGLQGIDDLVFRDLFDDDTTQRFYAMGDGMSVTAIADTTGTVQERYGYDAFGNTNVMDASFDPEDSSSYGWETRFCGYCWDDETNFYQVRNRYLHSSLGKWLSRDPIGERGGINLYQYASNSPIDRFDALGLREDDYPNPETPGGNSPNHYDPPPVGSDSFHWNPIRHTQKFILLRFPPSANMQKITQTIYSDLEQFKYFADPSNRGGNVFLVNRNVAKFRGPFLPPAVEAQWVGSLWLINKITDLTYWNFVDLTFNDNSHTVTGVTRPGHILKGTRTWQVKKGSTSCELEIITMADEQSANSTDEGTRKLFNSFGDLQDEVWTDYLSNIGRHWKQSAKATVIGPQ